MKKYTIGLERGDTGKIGHGVNQTRKMINSLMTSICMIEKINK